jgi:hypothetical protein
MTYTLVLDICSIGNAGIPRSQWNNINGIGQQEEKKMLNGRYSGSGSDRGHLRLLKATYREGLKILRCLPKMCNLL